MSGQLTNEQRAFIVKTYYETKSYVKVKKAFVEKFPDRKPPSTSSIQRNIQKYEAKGTSHNLNKGNSGRHRSGRTEDNIKAVKELLERDPNSAVSRRNPLGLSRSTFHSIMTKDLKMTATSLKKLQKSKKLPAQESSKSLKNASTSKTDTVQTSHTVVTQRPESIVSNNQLFRPFEYSPYTNDATTSSLRGLRTQTTGSSSNDGTLNWIDHLSRSESPHIPCRWR